MEYIKKSLYCRKLRKKLFEEDNEGVGRRSICKKKNKEKKFMKMVKVSLDPSLEERER